MSERRRRPRRHFGAGVVASIVLLAFGASGVRAAGPPEVISTVVEGVSATGAKLRASVNPNGAATAFRFEYITATAYEANLAAQPPRDPFTGAALAPLSGPGNAGAGSSPAPLSQSLVGLLPATSYWYRLRLSHTGEEPVFSSDRPFGTREGTNLFELLDHRGWEMVSPVEKNGGAIQPPSAISGGGVFQAAAEGGSITFSSADSFGSDVQGAPAGSQYLGTRGGGGWSTANITTPLLAGSYGDKPNGVPYQLFSADLGYGLLSNGERCRGDAGGGCPVATPPLPGSGAPAGYRDYYRRSASGTFESLLSATDLENTDLGPEEFELKLAAATPDLSHVLLSSCAALTEHATEVPAAGGCQEAAQNLYEWSGAGLELINLLPGQTAGSPGAHIAAQSGAISADGDRVYWTGGGDLYLRDGNQTKPVDAAQGGGGEFQIASADGATAYFTDGGNLYRFSAVNGTATALTAPSAVEGVLGASEDGSTVYYLTSGGLFVSSGATTTRVASAADPSDYPPATGTARVSADGSHLLFLSSADLTGYPSEGEPEVFLYGPPPGGGSPLLACVSCNPTGEGPQGPAAIPGARRNGTGTGATNAYKPRVLSASGNRVFFESPDALSSQDTNKRTDVYEWEAGGEGTCGRSGGCVQLISGGREATTSYFLDADEGGGEAFFLTAESLYPLDPGSYDVYVAGEGGGFSVPESPIPCFADACQVLPEAPEDLTPGTLVPNSGNPALKVTNARGGGKSKKHKKHPGKKSKKHGKRRAGGKR